MRNVIVAMYLSLDGVMENPAWTGPYFTDELATRQHELLFASDALLLGRVTYEGFAAAWPAMTDEQGFADRMNSLPKFVASTTLTETSWNAHVIEGDIVAAITELKQQPGENILVYGSAALIQTLMANKLIDEYRLMVHPVVLGSGKRLFKDGVDAKLQLVDIKTTATGVVILTYRPAN